MKITIYSLLVFVCTAFSACSTKVDLYADYKDIAVIYGLVDINADTNFLRISKAFCGSNDNPINAYEVALISDSSNYPEKLDAYIIEFQRTLGQQHQATGRKLLLDTLTIHNKEQGLFYAPDQVLYYTTEKFFPSENGNRYKYQLVIVKPNGDTLKAETTPVGGKVSLLGTLANFQSRPSEATNKLSFRSSPEGQLYDIKMQFNYREQHTGQAMTCKHVSWSYGARTLEEYDKVPGTEDVYFLEYSVNTLFNYLSTAIGNDTIWDANHPNVVRHIDNFVVTLSVGGHELYENFLMNSVLNNGLTTNAFSNIEGEGIGLFSSRTNIVKTMGLTSSTLTDLFGMKAWGFKEE